MLIREEIDDGGTEGCSASDAVLECPALPPPHSCLTVYATRIGFLWMCFLGACQQMIVVIKRLFVCQCAVENRGPKGSAAGTVPHLAMANVGESAKSDVVGMAMAKEGVGLKRTCFLESVS
jgi:hypothetical protein